jgi:hypothetical protein
MVTWFDEKLKHSNTVCFNNLSDLDIRNFNFCPCGNSQLRQMLAKLIENIAP